MGSELGSTSALYTRAAADLSWLLNHPPLYQLGRPLPGWFADRSVPSALPASLAQQLAPDRNLRLGHYTELLFGWWLSHHPQVAALHQASVLRHQGRTLGELDFLIRAPGEVAFHHLEISVKYFLGVGALQDPAAWIGLNPRDTLARKLTHMNSHQLRLSGIPEATRQLHAMGVRVQSVSGLVMGMLFYPLDALDHPGPVGASPDHLRGWWCRHSELNRLRGGRYLLLQRRYWLATQWVDNASLLLSADALIEQGLARPVMVSRQRQDRSGRWVEQDRGVVVPDHWPPLAALTSAAV